jgi:hypothetical protein
MSVSSITVGGKYVVEANLRERPFETVRSQGWRSRAYREVFTACFEWAFPLICRNGLS